MIICNQIITRCQYFQRIFSQAGGYYEQCSLKISLKHGIFRDRLYPLIFDTLLQHTHLVLQMAHHICQMIYTQTALLTSFADHCI